jgi:hypothetical protein
MPIIVTRKQFTLEKLAKSLLTSRASRAQLTEAVDVIRRANPGMAEGRIPGGTPVVVPPLKNERVDISAVGRRVGPGLADPERAVEELMPFAEENLELVTTRVSEASTELRRLAADRGTPVTKTEAATVLKSLEEDVAKAEGLLTTYSDAVPGWQDELAHLQELVRRTGR